MKCRIYEHIRKDWEKGHSEAIAIAAAHTEAVLVMANQDEADEISKEFGIDAVSVENISGIAKKRAVIIHNRAIIEEIEAIMRLLEEKAEIIMEISCTRPEVLKDAVDNIKRRNK